jgi:hypothetical protein
MLRSIPQISTWGQDSTIKSILYQLDYVKAILCVDGLIPPKTNGIFIFPLIIGGVANI